SAPLGPAGSAPRTNAPFDPTDPASPRTDASGSEPVRVRVDIAGTTVTVGSSTCVIRRTGESWECQVDGVTREVRRAEYRSLADSDAGPEIRSPMPGTLVRLHVSTGTPVEA